MRLRKLLKRLVYNDKKLQEAIENMQGGREHDR